MFAFHFKKNILHADDNLTLLCGAGNNKSSELEFFDLDVRLTVKDVDKAAVRLVRKNPSFVSEHLVSFHVIQWYFKVSLVLCLVNICVFAHINLYKYPALITSWRWC